MKKKINFDKLSETLVSGLPLSKKNKATWDELREDSVDFLNFMNQSRFLINTSLEFFENEVLGYYQGDVSDILYITAMVQRDDLLFSLYKYYDIDIIATNEYNDIKLSFLLRYALSSPECLDWMERKINADERKLNNFPLSLLSILNSFDTIKNIAHIHLARLDVIDKQMPNKKIFRIKVEHFMDGIIYEKNNKLLNAIASKSDYIIKSSIDRYIETIHKTSDEESYLKQISTVRRLLNVSDYISNEQKAKISKIYLDDDKFAFETNLNLKSKIENIVIKHNLSHEISQSQSRAKHKI